MTAVIKATPALIVLGWLLAASPPSTDAGAAADATPIEMAKEAVRDALRDPFSARFRNVRVTVDGVAGMTAVCGEVNAKNLFGAFTGFRRFVRATGTVEALSIDSALARQEDRVTFEEVWSMFCAGGPDSTRPSPELTTAERAAARRAILRCWDAPPWPQEMRDLSAVSLRLTLDRGGRVEDVHILGLARIGRDRIHLAVARSLEEAARACSPLTLPPTKYWSWRHLVLTFDIGEALGTCTLADLRAHQRRYGGSYRGWCRTGW